MSDPADFLSRWSRRKRAAAEGRAGADETKAPENESLAARATPDKPDARPESPDAEPAFDISKLPSLDSIGPDTDVSAFLQRGVPTALRHAALRRVWVTDPAIRDFRAPQELDWDFNAPGLPGFGEIGPDVDVKEMARRILGEPPTADTRRADLQTPSESQITSSAQESDGNLPADESDRGNHVADDVPSEQKNTAMLQSEEDFASQQENAASLRATSRRHGSALPE